MEFNNVWNINGDNFWQQVRYRTKAMLATRLFSLLAYIEFENGARTAAENE